jgi:hypothetical protein
MCRESTKLCHNSPYKESTQRQWTQRSNPLKISDLQRSVQNKYDLKVLRPNLGKPVPWPGRNYPVHLLVTIVTIVTIDEHDASQSRQIQGNANKTGRSENRHQCSQGQPVMLTYYNMLPSIKVQDLYKGKHAPWLRSMRLKIPMQKNAISRMLAGNAHIQRGHHLNPPQRPRIAKYKTLHKGNHKG